jgi:hypothetical protein
MNWVRVTGAEQVYLSHIGGIIVGASTAVSGSAVEGTVVRTPSSPPFDFYSTIDLRCGLIY